MADTPTPQLDELVALAKKHFLNVELHNLACYSLKFTCEHLMAGRDYSIIVDIAKDSSRRFSYIIDELASAQAVRLEYEVAYMIVEGLLMWRLMNDKDIIFVVHRRGLTLTDRGSLGRAA